MNTEKLYSEIAYEDFFNVIKENNISITEGLELLVSRVKTDYPFTVYPSLSIFSDEYNIYLERFLTIYQDQIDFEQLKRSHYKFWLQYCTYVQKFVLEDRKQLLFLMSLLKIDDAEYHLIFKAYPELLTGNNHEEFHYRFWTLVAKQQNTKRFISQYYRKFNTRRLATLITGNKEFWNCAQSVISYIIKIRSSDGKLDVLN